MSPRLLLTTAALWGLGMAPTAPRVHLPTLCSAGSSRRRVAGQEPSWTCFNPVGGSEGFHGRGRLPLPEQAGRTTATLGQDRDPVVRPPSLAFNSSAPLPPSCCSQLPSLPHLAPNPHLPSISIKSVLRRCPGVWGYYFPRRAATPCREQRKCGFLSHFLRILKKAGTNDGSPGSRGPAPLKITFIHMMIIHTINVQMENPWRVHYASMEGTKKTDTPR